MNRGSPHDPELKYKGPESALWLPEPFTERILIHFPFVDEASVWRRRRGGGVRAQHPGLCASELFVIGSVQIS